MNTLYSCHSAPILFSLQIPIRENSLQTLLPRLDSECYTYRYIKLNRRISDKRAYKEETVNVKNIEQAMRYLIKTDLYKRYNIKFDESRMELMVDQSENTVILEPKDNEE
jgi:hypothetical protein